MLLVLLLATLVLLVVLLLLVARGMGASAAAQRDNPRLLERKDLAGELLVDAVDRLEEGGLGCFEAC